MLSVLKTASPALRKAILQKASPSTLLALSEICLNTINGNNRLCPKSKKILQRYKKQMRMLSESKLPLHSRRKILIQSGGFLPVLIGTVLSGLIGTLVEKYAK